ncbi:hypothetical protein C8R44DRAFT_863127 [Mycena epipterygia]|nr:hypothetical protein C8R44DRAFT_863127 [Mycena epipterygia]
MYANHAGTGRPRMDALWTSCVKIVTRWGKYILSRMGYSAERRCARGACRAGCEESYLRERGPRRDTGAREVIARGDSCGLRMRRCGQQRMQIGGMREYAVHGGATPGTMHTGGVQRCEVHSQRDSAYVEGSGARCHAPACSPCVARMRIRSLVRGDACGQKAATGERSHDTLGIVWAGVFECRDGAAIQAACAFGDVGGATVRTAGIGWRTMWGCVVLARTRRRMRMEMGNDARRPLLAHPTHSPSELTQAGVRVAVDGGNEWRGDVDLTSPIRKKSFAM